MTILKRFVLACWLCLGGLLTPLQAQVAPLTGFPLREVSSLEALPPPPGGLIPYRQGELWGYSDTTGTMVVEACLRWSQPPPFFSQGFVYIPADALPARLRAASGEIITTFLNGRGELLRVRSSEVAVLEANGQLVRRLRQQAIGQRILESPAWQPDQGWTNNGFNYLRVGVLEKPTSALPADPPDGHARFDLHGLGAGRATHADKLAAPFRPRQNNPQHAPARPRYALTDSLSQHLTGHRFARIGAFQQGLAVAAVPGGKQPKQAAAGDRHQALLYGYLDRHGRWRIPPRFASAFAFRQGVAVVQEPGGRSGIIALDGRYLLPLQANSLEGPDEAGFVRMLVPDPGGAPVGAVIYLPPPGKPGFAAVRFSAGGAFLNGHAWAEREGRFGLLNQAGQWITTHSYSALSAPRKLRSQARDAQEEMAAETSARFDVARELATTNPPTLREAEAPRFDPYMGGIVRRSDPLPDTAYLVGQRAGRYGVVARATGRETVPARYDSVLFNAYRGIACLQRGDSAFVVTAATGRVLAVGRYGGIDFLTPQGRLRYLTRAQPAAWALLDTLGQLRTPWIPGEGFPTLEGWLLSHEPAGWTLRDFKGQIRYRSAHQITHPLWTRIWAQRQELDDTYRYLETRFLELSLGSRNPYARGVYLVHEPKGTRYLDADLHQVGQVAPADLAVLRSGWSVSGKESRRQLYSDEGRRMLDPPAGTKWTEDESFDFGQAWQVHGVLPSSKGYVTRGGRQLWQDTAVE